MDIDFLGLTLAEYAHSRGRSPQAVRPEYARLMRQATGLSLPRVVSVQRSDGVTKFCLGVADEPDRSLQVESVIIPMRNYHSSSWSTLCVSSQVGCRMGCRFCETARIGLRRNLSAAEIVLQRHAARELLLADGSRSTAWPRSYFADGIRNIVFMGMGEPLDNFEAVAQAIRVLHEPAGLNIPRSQITVCTVGRVDGIRRLAALGWRELRLAVSLNAAEDRLRDALMPINRSTPLAELQRALMDFPLPRRGRFLIAYVLLRGVNDSTADADALASWCAPLRCTVNLIPYNAQREAAFAVPEEDRIVAFTHRLRNRGIFVKRRITRGHDLMAACGQLGVVPRERRAFSSVARADADPFALSPPPFVEDDHDRS